MMIKLYYAYICEKLFIPYPQPSRVLNSLFTSGSNLPKPSIAHEWSLLRLFISACTINVCKNFLSIKRVCKLLIHIKPISALHGISEIEQYLFGYGKQCPQSCYVETVNLLQLRWLCIFKIIRCKNYEPIRGLEDWISHYRVQNYRGFIQIFVNKPLVWMY